jgi:hypothetical protein
MNQNSNPLRQFFRQPQIYLRLPSQGNHWPEHSLELPVNGELPVYPMTAIDEITYRTPDALFNGQAVVNVIQSCVPAIKNAWHMPSVDTNSVLIAIRMASYGHDLEIASTCPGCNESNDYTMDLRSVLDVIRMPELDLSLDQGDLSVFFEPLSYETQNSHSQRQFELQQTINSITRSELTEAEKLQRISDTLKEITQITVRVLAASVKGIKTPHAFVTEKQHIVEFLNNCDRSMFNAIKDHVVDLRTASDLKPVGLKCVNCSHEYQQPLNLDMSDFFEPAS